MKKIITLAPVAMMLVLAGQVQAATQADVQLQGSIVDTTCEVTANNGASALHVGSFSKIAFDAPKEQIGEEPLLVSLKNCSKDETGALLVSGIVTTGNETVFLSDVSQSAGFMMTREDNTTQVTNNASIPVVADANGALTYTFYTGMAVLDKANVQPGNYHAPIKISYVSN